MDSKQVVLIQLSVDELKSLIESCFSTQLAKATSPERPLEEYLTPTEAASFLKVSKVTLHKWKVSGVVSFIQEGTTVRYEKQSLLEALRAKPRTLKRRKTY